MPISGLGGGTVIATADGPVPVDWLRPGDEVLTFGGGFCPVIWVGRDCLRPAMQHVLAAPISSKPGAGPQTYLAARHRVALTGRQIELHFGMDTVLAEAAQIAPATCPFPLARHGTAACSIMLTETPQIIQADGLWVETLQLNDATLGCLTDTALRDLARGALDLDAHSRPPLPCLAPWEAESLGISLATCLAHEPPLSQTPALQTPTRHPP